MADFESKLRNMHAACRWYDPKPIHQYTDREAYSFARRQARDAAATMKLNSEEFAQYADVIYSSILYFNHRSAEHRSHMRYLRECEMLQREAEEERRRDAQRQKQKFVFIK